MANDKDSISNLRSESSKTDKRKQSLYFPESMLQGLVQVQQSRVRGFLGQFGLDQRLAVPVTAMPGPPLLPCLLDQDAPHGLGCRREEMPPAVPWPVRLVADLSVEITDRHVLVVDDIVDTGHTLALLKRELEARRPRSVKTCVLLDKTGRRQTEVRIDYVGFTIPNVFVVGYGLDYDGLYRNLPHVATLEEI